MGARASGSRKATAIAIWLALCSLPLPAAAEGGFSLAQKRALLAGHNEVRARLSRGEVSGQPAASGMNELFWDDGLAALAHAWAKQCKWRHSPVSSRRPDAKTARFRFDPDHAAVGENLYAVSGRELDLQALLAGQAKWWGEHAGYRYATSGCKGVCGHYTQMAWAATRYVGCGYARCDGLQGKGSTDIYYVCNYFPAGNVVGRKPYAKGSACTACDSDRHECRAGLCSGCMAPGFPFCADFASNCTELASACPENCNLDSDDSLCGACRRSCNTCPDDWLAPEATCEAVPR